MQHGMTANIHHTQLTPGTGRVNMNFYHADCTGYISRLASIPRCTLRVPLFFYLQPLANYPALPIVLHANFYGNGARSASTKYVGI